jgi:hypothetical protein
MPNADELRRRAATFRRAAAVPTTGSAIDDRILIELAEGLESEAEAIERGYKPSPGSGAPKYIPWASGGGGS